MSMLNLLRTTNNNLDFPGDEVLNRGKENISKLIEKYICLSHGLPSPEFVSKQGRKLGKRNGIKRLSNSVSEKDPPPLENTSEVTRNHVVQGDEDVSSQEDIEETLLKRKRELGLSDSFVAEELDGDVIDMTLNNMDNEDQQTSGVANRTSRYNLRKCTGNSSRCMKLQSRGMTMIKRTPISKRTPVSKRVKRRSVSLIVKRLNNTPTYNPKRTRKRLHKSVKKSKEKVSSGHINQLVDHSKDYGKLVYWQCVKPFGISEGQAHISLSKSLKVFVYRPPAKGDTSGKESDIDFPDDIMFVIPLNDENAHCEERSSGVKTSVDFGTEGHVGVRQSIRRTKKNSTVQIECHEKKKLHERKNDFEVIEDNVGREEEVPTQEKKNAFKSVEDKGACHEVEKSQEERAVEAVEKSQEKERAMETVADDVQWHEKEKEVALGTVDHEGGCFEEGEKSQERESAFEIVKTKGQESVGGSDQNSDHHLFESHKEALKDKSENSKNLQMDDLPLSPQNSNGDERPLEEAQAPSCRLPKDLDTGKQGSSDHPNDPTSVILETESGKHNSLIEDTNPMEQTSLVKKRKKHCKRKRKHRGKKVKLFVSEDDNLGKENKKAVGTVNKVDTSENPMSGNFKDQFLGSLNLSPIPSPVQPDSYSLKYSKSGLQVTFKRRKRRKSSRTRSSPTRYACSNHSSLPDNDSERKILQPEKEKVKRKQSSPCMKNIEQNSDGAMNKSLIDLFIDSESEDDCDDKGEIPSENSQQLCETVAVTGKEISTYKFKSTKNEMRPEENTSKTVKRGKRMLKDNTRFDRPLNRVGKFGNPSETSYDTCVRNDHNKRSVRENNIKTKKKKHSQEKLDSNFSDVEKCSKHKKNNKVEDKNCAVDEDINHDGENINRMHPTKEKLDSPGRKRANMMLMGEPLNRKKAMESFDRKREKVLNFSCGRMALPEKSDQSILNVNLEKRSESLVGQHSESLIPQSKAISVPQKIVETVPTLNSVIDNSAKNEYASDSDLSSSSSLSLLSGDNNSVSIGSYHSSLKRIIKLREQLPKSGNRRVGECSSLYDTISSHFDSNLKDGSRMNSKSTKFLNISDDDDELSQGNNSSKFQSYNSSKFQSFKDMKSSRLFSRTKFWSPQKKNGKIIKKSQHGFFCMGKRDIMKVI